MIRVALMRRDRTHRRLLATIDDVDPAWPRYIGAGAA